MTITRRPLASDGGHHFATNRVAVGEETLPRDFFASASVAINASTLRLSYFTARLSETTTQVRILSGSTAAGATPTLVRIGLYEIAETGDGTLVASTANDTALFAAASTAYTKSWSSPYAKVAGRRYAVAVLVVTAATAPTLTGIANGGPEFTVAPRLTGSVNSQSDLPASFTSGSVSAGSARFYAVVL